MLKDYFIDAEVAAEKFFLRELLSFFIEKRKSVFADSDLTFSVEDFKEFTREKKLYNVMSQDITFEKIDAHLDICRNFFKRDGNNKMITPKSPILTYKKKPDINFFVISDCYSEYIKNALYDIGVSLRTHDWSQKGEQREDEETNVSPEEMSENDNSDEDKKISVYKKMEDHRISFNNRKTRNPLGNKECAFFDTLKNNFGTECPYTVLFNAYKRLGQFNGMSSEPLTPKDKKRCVNDGITSLNKKLYEISGNPNAIETIPGRASKYRLTY